MRLKSLLSLLLVPTLAHAQGAHRLSQIITRSQGVQAQVEPNAKITVCAPGTGCVTHATIYSDIALTQPALNPVTADVNGNFSYYVPAGCYDEKYTYPGANPQMAFNVCLGSAAGSQTVVEVNSVATSPVSPVNFVNSSTVTWSLSGATVSATANSGLLLQHNGVNLTDQLLLNFNDSTPAAPVGSQNVTFQTDSSGRLSAYYIPGEFEQQVIPPIGGQYVVVYPTVGTITSDPRGDSTIGPQGGVFNWSCSGIFCTVAPGTDGHWAGFALPSYVNPANVTAIYADAVSSATYLDGAMPTGGANTTKLYCDSGLGPTPTLLPSFGTPSNPWAAFEGTALSTITAATISATTCFVHVGVSNQFASGMSLNVPSVRLLVYYSGPPPPARTAIDIVPPLSYNPALLTLGDTLQPRWLDGGTDTVVQSLTSANTSVAALIINNTSVSGGGFAFVEEGSANTYPGSGGIFNVQTAHFPLIIKPNDDVILSSLGTSTSPICPNGTNGALTTTGCAGGGGGGLSGQTTGYLPLATSATTSTTSSALQDTGSSLVYHGTGTAHGLTMAEGTTLSGLAGSDILMTDATTHRWLQNPNNIGPLALVGTSTTPATSGHCPQYASNGYDIVDSGSVCAAGTSFITSLTTTGSSGAATVSSGVLNIPVYTGGSSVLGPLQVPNLFTAVNPPTTLSPFTVQANQTIDGNTKYFSDGTAYNTAGTNYASSGNYIADQTFTCLANPGKCSDTFLLNLITKYAAAVDGNGQLPINLSSTLTPAYYSAFDLHHAFASPDGAIFLPQMLYLYCQKYGLASTQCGTAYTASVAAIKSAWAFYPRNGTTHLFTVVSGNEYLMTTGFEEYVRNTGDVANGNVWYAADMADMAAIATAQADSTNATFFNSEHSTIVTAIRANLINGTTGLLISATGQNSGNDDIATSSLAVACDLRPSVMAACGVLTSGQKTTIENYFNTNYSTITNANGAVLQTPQSAWAQFGCIQAGGGTPYSGGGCPGYTGSQYQGALWFYFNDDFALALGQVNPAKVGTFLNTALNPTSADTAMEWNDRASTAMPSGSSTNYMASNQWEVAVNNAFPLAQTVTAGVGCINKYSALVNSGCAAGSGLIYGTNAIATAATPVVFDGSSTNEDLFQMKGTNTTGTRFKLDNGSNHWWFLNLGSTFGSYAGSGCMQVGPASFEVAMQCWQNLSTTTGVVSMMPGLSLKWSNTSGDPNQPQATGISQPSAGTLSIDSTTVGNHGGNVTLNNLTINGTCTGCGSGLIYGTNNITTASTPVIFSGSTTNNQLFKMTSANIANTAVFLENTSAGSHGWADLVSGSASAGVGDRLWLDTTTGYIPFGVHTTSSTAGSMILASAAPLTWSSSNSAATSSVDTGLSRPSAGTLSLDSATVGNHGGNLSLNNLTINGTCTGCGAGSNAFSALTGSTNTTAAMVVGSGASLAPTGTGTIQATNIASTISNGSGIGLSGAGTVASPYVLTATGTSGVSTFTGDGALLSNSASTGAVTATLANAAAHKFFGNNTGSSAAPGYQSIGIQDYSPNAYIAGGGSANAQTAAYSPAITSLVAGLNACWLPTAANTTTTPTFAPNGLTAKTITKTGTSALAASDLTTTAVACAIYDGTQWQLQNPQTSSGGGITGAEVNITASVTVSGCTVTSGSCNVVTPGTSISFSSIPGTYNHLIIRMNAASSVAANGAIPFVQFNGDTGSNYTGQYFQALVASPSSGQATSASPALFAIPGSTGVANSSGSFTLNIPYYANTTFKKNMSVVGGTTNGASVTGNTTYSSYLYWSNTAAITSILINAGGANFVAGSSFSIYGVL